MAFSPTLDYNIMAVPNLTFNAKSKYRISAHSDQQKKTITLKIEEQRIGFSAPFYHDVILDLETAQALKKHLGWLIAHAKKQSHEG